MSKNNILKQDPKAHFESSETKVLICTKKMKFPKGQCEIQFQDFNY